MQSWDLGSTHQLLSFGRRRCGSGVAVDSNHLGPWGDVTTRTTHGYLGPHAKSIMLKGGGANPISVFTEQTMPGVNNMFRVVGAL